MKKYKIGPVAMILIIVAFWAGIAGFVMNIVDIFTMLGGPINAELAFRVIGIFVGPLGAILGYF